MNPSNNQNLNSSLLRQEDIDKMDKVACTVTYYAYKTVYYNMFLSKVLPDPKSNRSRLLDTGVNLRTKVRDIRFTGKEPGKQVELEILSFLLGLIAHNEVHNNKDNFEERKSTLFNIALTAALLPKSWSRKDIPFNHPAQPIRDKYAINKIGIWYYLEQMQNFCTPKSQPSSIHNYYISAERINSILDTEIPKLKAMVLSELFGLKHHINYNLRTEPWRLLGIYSYVNYYRERKAIEKILYYIDPLIISKIDYTTKIGKCAIMRILEIIGEAINKDLHRCTLLNAPDIDWNLFVRIRHKLAHNETFITQDFSDTIFESEEFTLLFKQIITTDLPLIRKYLSEINNKHLLIKPASDNDNAIMGYYKHTSKISAGLKLEIELFIKELCDQKIITSENRENILDNLNNHEFVLKGQDTIDIIEVINTELKEGKEKLQQTNSSNLKELNKLSENFSVIYTKLIKGYLFSLEAPQIIKKAKEIINIFIDAKYPLILPETGKELCSLIEPGKSIQKFYEEIENIIKNSDPLKEIEQIILYKECEVLNNEKEISTREGRRVKDFYQSLKDNGHIIEKDISQVDGLVNKLSSIKGEEKKKLQNEVYLKQLDIILKNAAIMKVAQSTTKEKLDLIRKIKERIEKRPRENEYLQQTDLKQNKQKLFEVLAQFVHLKLIEKSQQEDIQICLDKDNFEKLKILLDYVKQKIEEEKINNKSPEAKLLEKIGGKIEFIGNEIKKERDNFDHSFDFYPTSSIHFNGIRTMLGKLPDEELYLKSKQGKNLNLRKAANLALKSVGSLNDFLGNLPSYDLLKETEREFKDLSVFVAVSANYANPALELFSDHRYLKANKVVVSSSRYQLDNKFVIPGFSGGLLTIDDALSGKANSSNSSEVFGELITYISSNKEKIISELEETAKFVTLVEELTQNPILCFAIEYILGTIYPYIKHLKTSSNDVFTDSLQALEFNFHRNYNIHGSLYVDKGSIQKEKLLIQYATKFLKTIGPRIEEFQELNFRRDWQEYISLRALNNAQEPEI